MLNGSPLNAGPLNGSGAAPALPAVTITPVVSVLWDIRLMLGGVDVSSKQTGGGRVEREGGAASLADFVISLDPGTVNPADYIGKSVEIYFRLWDGGWVEELLFTGQVIRPQYSMQERLISCDCSDRLQDAIEALPVAEVDAVTEGIWSADVFEAPEGRSRWDYAQERMSTRPASLQKSVAGNLQVVNWAAGSPAWIFPAGSVIDQSMDWTPVELNERINVVEIELDYRFTRMRERHQDFVWMHPDITGPSIDSSFCLWRTATTTLITIEKVEEACRGAGYHAVLSGAAWIELPPTGVYCSPPTPWINSLESEHLLLGGEWTAARRWTQAITETYTLRIEAPASIAQAGEVIRRDRITAETQSDRASAFESATFTTPEPDAVEDALGDFVVDLRETTRLDDAVAVGVSMARVQILAAHRENRLSFQLPTADTLGVTLENTIRVEDEVAGQSIACQAKVYSITHEWSFDDGSAITSIALAVSQGGGEHDDPVTTPAAPDSTPSGTTTTPVVLPSQLGGEYDGQPPYDASMIGFSGNYQSPWSSAAEVFETRIRCPIPEIPADNQDEFLAGQSETYRVIVPNDLLEF